jgi:hypothetical protein
MTTPQISTDTSPILDLLSDEGVEKLFIELGATELEQEAKERLIVGLGENIIARVTIEAMKRIPEDHHEAFRDLIGGGDPEALHNLITPFIPDFGEFMKIEAQKELEETKQLLTEEGEGAE